jgi:hypothetical protein
MFKVCSTILKIAAAALVISSSLFVSASASTQNGFEQVGVTSSAQPAGLVPPGPRPPPK